MADFNTFYLEKVKEARDINVIFNLMREMVENQFFQSDFNEELKKEFEKMVQRYLILKELEKFDDKSIQNLIR